MSDMKNMMDWFGKRKEDSVQTGVRKHGLAVLDVVSELGRAIAHMAEGDPKSTQKSIDRMILSERDADRIEDRLTTSISTGELSAQSREDLMRLIRKTDKTADWALQGGIHIQMVVETGVSVPPQMWEALKQMSTELTLEVKLLIKALESMASNPQETLRTVESVKDQERIIDQIHFATLKKILMSDMDYKGVMLMKGLVEAIETSADACKSCADTLAVLMTTKKA